MRKWLGTVGMLVVVMGCGANVEAEAEPAPATGPGSDGGSTAPDAGDTTPDAGSTGTTTTDAGGTELQPGASFTVATYPNGIVATDDAVFVVRGARHSGPNSIPVQAGMQHAVQVFGRDGQLRKEIAVAGGGHAAVLSPDRQRLYVAHFSLDNAVTVINTVAGAVEAVVGGAGQMEILVPDALVASPDGAYVYVANNGPSSTAWVNRINTITNTLDDWRVDVTGGYLCGLELSPDGSTLYVNSWTGGTVHRVDVPSRTVVQTTPVGDFPHTSVADARGQALYVMASGANGVRKLNALDLSLIENIPGPYFGYWGGPVSGVRSASGNHLFVANYELGSVAVVDTNPQSASHDRVIHQESVGTNPVFMALSPDGTRLYVANNGASTVSVVDVSAYR
ncbi:MAG: YncE family protein [Myxococcota bacterium]